MANLEQVSRSKESPFLVSTERQLSRREFLHFLGVTIGALIFNSCQSSPSKQTSAVEAKSTPEFTPILPSTPTNTLIPTETSTRVPTFTAIPSATLTEVPTSTPTFTSEPSPTIEPTATATETLIPTATATEAPAKPESILELEGFTTVWNGEKERWVYKDMDGATIAYWDQEGNEGKGRVELVESIKELDFEKHRGLFTPWTPEQTEKAFIEGWEKERKVKIPIPFKISKGKIMVKTSLRDILSFRNIPEGTILYAPFSGSVEKTALTNAKNIYLWYVFDETAMSVAFPTWEDYIGPEGGIVTANAGTPLLKISTKTFSPRYARGLFKGDQIDMICESKGPNVSNFTSLQRNDQGRLVYLQTS